MGSYSFRHGWVQACNSVLRGGTSYHPSQVTTTIARPGVGALMTQSAEQTPEGRPDGP